MSEYLDKKRDIIEPKIVPHKDYKNYLMLGYYRNPLNHIFFNEGCVIVSLLSYGTDIAWKEGVDQKELFEKTAFIANLLRREEVIRDKIDNPQNFDKTIQLMISRKILNSVGEGKYAMKSTGETVIIFAASLIWQMIDSYYVTLLYTLSMLKNKGIEYS